MLPSTYLQREVYHSKKFSNAKDDLRKYYPLLSKEAFKFSKKFPLIPFDDLFGYGLFGLVKAHRKFQGEENARLPYYMLMIDGEIQHGIFCVETQFVHQTINKIKDRAAIQPVGILNASHFTNESDDRMVTVENILNSENNLSHIEDIIVRKELKFTDLKAIDICKQFKLSRKQYKEILASAIEKIKLCLI